MAQVYDGSDPAQRAEGLTHAVSAAKRGELVACNVDGVYALLTDAFSHTGIERITALKGRPSMSVPVLVPRAATVDGVAVLLGESGVAARALMRDCWPGPLTLLARAQPSLPWRCSPDGVVALRMPLHPWTLALVAAIGPTACVPSHLPEQAAHASIVEVEQALGGVVSVYLDGGPCLPGQMSTIVDVTGDRAIVVRDGAFTRAHLATIAGELG